MTHLSSLGDTVGEIVGTNSLIGRSISQQVSFESSELPTPSGLLSAMWLSVVENTISQLPVPKSPAGYHTSPPG